MDRSRVALRGESVCSGLSRRSLIRFSVPIHGVMLGLRSILRGRIRSLAAPTAVRTGSLGPICIYFQIKALPTSVVPLEIAERRGFSHRGSLCAERMRLLPEAGVKLLRMEPR